MPYYREKILHVDDISDARLSVTDENEKRPFKISLKSGYSILCSYDDLVDIGTVLEDVLEVEHEKFDEALSYADDFNLDEYFNKED